MEMRDEEIIKKGLSCALSKGDGSYAISQLYIEELGRFAAYGCDDTDSFVEKCRELIREIIQDELPSSLRAALMAALCKSGAEHITGFGKEIKISDFFEGEERIDSKIAYVKNANSDEAYRVFSGVIENASVTYSGSFSQACEDVYYGRVPYCILPYETSEEGTLSGFMKLIRKYELYPHLVCVCAGTRFALLGRSPCDVIPNGQSQAYLKLTFYRPEKNTLSKISTAVNELSLITVRSESFPVSFEDGLYGLSVTIYGQIESVLPFLLYLALEVPECSDKAIFFEVI